MCIRLLCRMRVPTPQSYRHPLATYRCLHPTSKTGEPQHPKPDEPLTNTTRSTEHYELQAPTQTIYTGNYAH